MQLTGYWYPANSSARYPATLHAVSERYTLKINEQDDLQGTLADIVFSNRVGNIPRKLTLENRSIFETQENDLVDELLRQTHHKNSFFSTFHMLETSWRWVILAVVLLIAVNFSAIYWGLPWASKTLAYTIPISVNEHISKNTFDFLDEYILEPSELPEERQQAIRQHFNNTLLSTQSEEINYRLYFRQLEDTPNAFALPSGQIIITDALIELADNQKEIDSILLHEIGHVVHRHGLQQIIHNSFITIAITMITGDATAMEDIMVALPVFLLESHYSRDSESEADTYAFEQMVKLNIDPKYFADMFEKIIPSDASQSEEKYSEYLSTHPASLTRIQKAKDYSAEHFLH